MDWVADPGADGTTAHLDSAQLKCHLTEAGYGRIVSEILSPSAYIETGPNGGGYSRDQARSLLFKLLEDLRSGTAGTAQRLLPRLKSRSQR